MSAGRSLRGRFRVQDRGTAHQVRTPKGKECPCCELHHGLQSFCMMAAVAGTWHWVMDRESRHCLASIGMGVALCLGLPWTAAGEEAFKYQYEFGPIGIPRAQASEPIRHEFSVDLALRFVEQGAAAWTRGRKCVSCHTTGSYLALRPSLSGRFGEPNREVRDLFVQLLRQGVRQLGENRGLGDSHLIYIVRGLAEWDAHVSGELSADTRLALQQLFDRQLPTGEWTPILQTWPPLESSAFQEATVAAMAVGVAPGWLSGLTDPALKAGVERLKTYFRTVEPPHDYGRVVLLWASTRLAGLLEEREKAEIIEMIRRKQRPDGGWSLRSFAQPEEWGDGSRAGKLRQEKEFSNPPSDGHQTGLALIALLEAGVSAKDSAVRRGVRWLLGNQRQSGRWWTRSLNTDEYHFITYSGTLYPLAALHLSGALSEEPAVAALAPGRR